MSMSERFAGFLVQFGFIMGCRSFFGFWWRNYFRCSCLFWGCDLLRWLLIRFFLAWRLTRVDNWCWSLVLFIGCRCCRVGSVGRLAFRSGCIFLDPFRNLGLELGLLRLLRFFYGCWGAFSRRTFVSVLWRCLRTYFDYFWWWWPWVRNWRRRCTSPFGGWGLCN